MLEGVVIGLVGVVLGLVANFYNPDGVDLGRDYFSRAAVAHPMPASHPQPTTAPNPTDVAPAEEPVADSGHEGESELDQLRERLEPYGIGLVDFEQLRGWYEDPAYQAGAYVVIDARNEEEYEKGHIPGAFLVDHFRLERYIDNVLPYVLGAEKVVVHCTGGQCEDSELVAIDLFNYGVDPTVIQVFPGGIERWEKENMPVELGQRFSGRLKGGQ